MAKKQTATRDDVKWIASGIAIYCAHDSIVEVETLIPNPRNPNRHDDEQIRLLAKIIKYQGWRVPISISLRSGFVVRGHGRIMAAKELGLETVPVDYQYYDSEAAEWSDLIADNRISELSVTDNPALKELIEDLQQLVPDYDKELAAWTENAYASLINQFPNSPNDEYLGMPAFSQTDAEQYKSIIVHFLTEGDYMAFAQLIGQQLTPQTRYIWYPKLIQQSIARQQINPEEDTDIAGIIDDEPE